jgi:hypothetical protein
VSEQISMYTPGPWRLDEYKGGRRIVVDGYPPIPIQIFRNRANALLCAAAPELLEALKALLKAEWMVEHNWGGNRPAVIAKAEEAIWKAERP